MIKLKIIHASTREGRKGIAISQWLEASAQKYPDFDTELLDLKKINLPFFDEPHHPRTQQYVHRHTQEWSEKIAAADAFIFVTSEYNHGMPATLKNALDFLSVEWNYKPVAIVGYGGLSSGTRAVQQLKQVANALKMFAFDGLLLPFFSKQINNDGKFEPTEGNLTALDAMFAELRHLGKNMQILRQPELVG